MLAIIIPYYKHAFFDQTLKSLANQTDKRFTVYIGDDASSENPRALLDQYQKKINFVYHRFENNLGGTSLPQQWKRCIALSDREEWLMILGDDDYLGDNVVEQFYAHLPQFQCNTNVVRFSSRTIVEVENHKAAICKHPIWETATDAYLRKFKLITRSSLSEYVFTLKSYEKFGFYDYPLAWNSDDRAWLDFSDEKPIYSINEAIVCVRLSNLNITGMKDNLALKNASLVAFYSYLIRHKLHYYIKYERTKIIRKYHYELQISKQLGAKDWIFLIKNYVLHADVSVIKGFIKKYI